MRGQAVARARALELALPARPNLSAGLQRAHLWRRLHSQD